MSAKPLERPPCPSPSVAASAKATNPDQAVDTARKRESEPQQRSWIGDVSSLDRKISAAELEDRSGCDGTLRSSGSEPRIKFWIHSYSKISHCRVGAGLMITNDKLHVINAESLLVAAELALVQ